LLHPGILLLLRSAQFAPAGFRPNLKMRTVGVVAFPRSDGQNDRLIVPVSA